MDQEDDEDHQESLEDSSNNEGDKKDDDDQGGGDLKKGDKSEDEENNDDGEPSPSKYVRKERRIKRKNDKSNARSSKHRHSLGVENSPSLQGALTEHEEHHQFLSTVIEVQKNHELR